MLVSMECPVEQLQVGDLLSRPIYRDDGLVLLAKGIILSQEDIDILRAYEDTIFIRRETPDVRSVGDLQNGDVIAYPVVSKESRQVIARGTVVSDSVKADLKNYTGNVYIRKDYDEPEPLKRLELSSDVMERVHKGISYMFSGAPPQEICDTAREVAVLLCDTIKDSDAVAVDLSLLKVSDEYTFKHSIDVATLASFTAISMGYDLPVVQQITVAGMLHDLGKIKVPNEIINAPRKLTEEEFSIMAQHPKWGWEMVHGRQGITEEIELGILQHQEKSNGTGYCSGLKGNCISEIGRLICVTDFYDALVTERSYKKGMTPLQAVSIMMKDEGHCDRLFFNAFLSCLCLYEPGHDVVLSNGDSCVVLAHNDGYPFRPIVRNKANGVVYDLLRDSQFREINIQSYS